MKVYSFHQGLGCDMFMVEDSLADAVTRFMCWLLDTTKADKVVRDDTGISAHYNGKVDYWAVGEKKLVKGEVY